MWKHPTATQVSELPDPCCLHPRSRGSLPTATTQPPNAHGAPGVRVQPQGLRRGSSGQCIPHLRAVSPARRAKGRAESCKASQPFQVTPRHHHQLSPPKYRQPTPLKGAAEGSGLLLQDTRFASHQGTHKSIFQFIHRIWLLLKHCELPVQQPAMSAVTFPSHL